MNKAVNQASISIANLKTVNIPLPTGPNSLAEQKRIAAILDKADAIRRKRQQALQLTDDFLRSTFLKLFGDPVTNPMGWDVAQLGSVSDVQGGLQVTQKRNTLELEAPYLRVANVYRDKLKLEEVKTIRVTEAELNRVLLQTDDILIVEGHGNPNEVGRSALWDGSIEGCLHQNHLIRVRPDKQRLLATFASHYINSPGGRRQMFKSGKTTSGLNTISSRNVKETIVILPPIELQIKFQRLVYSFNARVVSLNLAVQHTEDLFKSLQQRAFSGQL